jgi:TonB family protein
VQVKIGANGEVVDGTVLSGPEELRKAVLTSVLDWHFTREAAGSTRQVTVTFQLPKSETPGSTMVVQPDPGGTITGVVGGVPGGVQGGVRSGVIGGIIGSVPARMSAAPREGKVAAIRVIGLGDQAKSELLSRLPIREGDAFTPETYRKVADAASEYDEHLTVSAFAMGNGEVTLQVAAPRTTATTFPTPDVPVPPGAIRVGGNTQQAKLISQAKPVYPSLAKQAHISGVVRLSALIGKDGGVKNLTLLSGHPLLIEAAMDAVREWRYETTLLNGAPVEVLTQIDVNFTLSQ